MERDLSGYDFFGLFIDIDGAKGLRSANKKVFVDKAMVQRCQWHKRENIVSYLPKSIQAPVAQEATVGL